MGSINHKISSPNDGLGDQLEQVSVIKINEYWTIKKVDNMVVKDYTNDYTNTEKQS
jgi:hypothetical protein